ncbi:hypothetical protein DEJ50_14395 [Streptomyces venezuelae]|uniref:Uncharacterized protein n=1 Tax=Streptomyces venezuelae TaxID=54571 RepID=A0A5P2DE64_STRVZ|nr:hypothetical protein DEJ50_14395 [Streptomyces venezuelae]
MPDAATQYIPSVPAGPGAPPPEAATQYIPPVPPGPGTPHAEAATQYIPPVPPGPGTPHAEAATQYIPPVPAGPGAPLPEAATQYIPPVPAGPGTPHAEAATQYIPPVPPGPGAPGAPLAEAATQYIQPVPGDEQGHTQHLPPIQEPVLRQPPPQPPQQRQQRRQPQPQPRVQPPAQPQQYAYAQPPFEQEDPPRRVSGGIIAAGVIGLAVAGLGVGALLSEPGKAQNNDPAAVSSVPTPSGSTGAAAAEAPVDPARSQAVQLDKLLADSNDSRSAVIRAVEDIKVCKNLDQAATDLRDAARQRDGLVTRLQDVKIDQLPDNARLTAALTKAWKSSAAADRSYAAWAEEVGDDRGDDRRDDRDDKKGCKDGKARPTGNAAAGNKASGEASQAKESAATMWNRIAVKYELTKRDKSQL